MRRAVVALLAVVVATVALFSGQAASHPSLFSTLTLDLILDSRGLVLIDGAMNHATYDLAPSPERGVITGEVLDALGVPHGSVEVDRDTSLLYHEVGFTIWLHKPFANTVLPGEVVIDSRRLQDVAGAHDVALLLDICRVDSPSQVLNIESAIPAAPPDRSGAGSATDRRDCQSWSMQPDDPASIVKARVVGDATTPPSDEIVTAPCPEPQRGIGPDPAFVRRGQIALRADPLNVHARATDAMDTSARVVANSTILVEQGIPVELHVPTRWRGRVSVGIREGRRATSVLRIPKCGVAGSSQAWSAVVATFWTGKPTCAHIVVKTPTEKHRFRLGIGVQCRPN